MIYQIESGEFKQVDNIKPGKKILALLTPGNIDSVRESIIIDSQTLQECTNASVCKAEVWENYIFGTLCIPKKGNLTKEKLHMGFYFWKDGFLLVETTGQAEQIVGKILKRHSGKNIKLEHFVYDFFMELLEGNIELLQQREEHIAKMEDAVLSGTLENFNHKMITFRKEFLYLYRYYDQLVDLGQIFQENENKLFTAEGVRRFRMFTERANRLCNHTQLLKDYSIQIREIYQAQVDIHQNKIMKILTVVTTICLPLSMIAGWYGMNFANMPELRWEFGYPLVILISIIVVAVSIWFFKKKRFF